MKCTWQDGGRYCEGGKVAYAPCSEDVGPLVTENDCPACNGTGEAELDADQAEKFLRDNYIWWEPGYTGLGPEDKIVSIEFGRGKKRKIIDGEEILYKAIRLNVAEGPTLTAALNAAAKSIKERGKE